MIPIRKRFDLIGTTSSRFSIHEQLKTITEREELKSKRILPIGLGALSASILDEEFCDYMYPIPKVCPS